MCSLPVHFLLLFESLLLPFCQLHLLRPKRKQLPESTGQHLSNGRAVCYSACETEVEVCLKPFHPCSYAIRFLFGPLTNSSAFVVLFFTYLKCYNPYFFITFLCAPSVTCCNFLQRIITNFFCCLVFYVCVRVYRHAPLHVCVCVHTCIYAYVYVHTAIVLGACLNSFIVHSKFF